MNLQGTDIHFWDNWCTALEAIPEKFEEKLLVEMSSSKKDIIKNMLLLIDFDKKIQDCKSDDIPKIVKRVRALINTARNQKLDLTKDES